MAGIDCPLFSLIRWVDMSGERWKECAGLSGSLGVFQISDVNGPSGPNRRSGAIRYILRGSSGAQIFQYPGGVCFKICNDSHQLGISIESLETLSQWFFPSFFLPCIDWLDGWIWFRVFTSRAKESQ